MNDRFTYSAHLFIYAYSLMFHDPSTDSTARYQRDSSNLSFFEVFHVLPGSFIKNFGQKVSTSYIT